jgi:hypothetical protein
VHGPSLRGLSTGEPMAATSVPRVTWAAALPRQATGQRSSPCDVPTRSAAPNGVTQSTSWTWPRNPAAGPTSSTSSRVVTTPVSISRSCSGRVRPLRVLKDGPMTAGGVTSRPHRLPPRVASKDRRSEMAVGTEGKGCSGAMPATRRRSGPRLGRAPRQRCPFAPGRLQASRAAPRASGQRDTDGSEGRRPRVRAQGASGGRRARRTAGLKIRSTGSLAGRRLGRGALPTRGCASPDPRAARLGEAVGGHHRCAARPLRLRHGGARRARRRRPRRGGGGSEAHGACLGGTVGSLLGHAELS